jgi:hypoxanthine phosphoribosyltransferase
VKVPRILITNRQIQVRTQILGEEITRFYQNSPRKLTDVIVTLKGAAPFASLLLQHLPYAVHVHYVRAKSYEGGSETSNEHVQVSGIENYSDWLSNGHKKAFLIIEDIVDTGRTLAAIYDLIGTRSDVKTVSLLNKPSRRVVGIHPDWFGFEVTGFVYGFGLDLDESFRGLPNVMEMRDE